METIKQVGTIRESKKHTILKKIKRITKNSMLGEQLEEPLEGQVGACEVAMG